MKEESNRAGNVLRRYGNVEKGDRVFIFMPRSPELYFIMLGAIKIGAIAGPLFEAFMEGAVKDRLENSEAKVVVTTPELLERIPVDKLPHLQHVFVVGERLRAARISSIMMKQRNRKAQDWISNGWIKRRLSASLYIRFHWYAKGRVACP